MLIRKSGTVHGNSLLKNREKRNPMPNILNFSRNRSTGVNQIDESTIISTCRLQDFFTNGFVEIKVKLPDLEIVEIKGDFERTHKEEYKNDVNIVLKKVIGVRIGSGMLKIIKGLMGDGSNYKELIFMVEECCHGVILSFTKKNLLLSPKNAEDSAEFFRNLVKDNIRLYNRCAAFAPGSSIVEGIDPP